MDIFCPAVDFNECCDTAEKKQAFMASRDSPNAKALDVRPAIKQPSSEPTLVEVKAKGKQWQNYYLAYLPF